MSISSSSKWSRVQSGPSRPNAGVDHHHYDPEWEAKEELRLRELEEARARATQMERTMVWWSDCTANWREKWCKVRTERNKSREESRILRGRLEVSSKECTVLRREREDLLHEIDKLRKEVTLRRTADAEREEEAAMGGAPYLCEQRVQAERDVEKPLFDPNADDARTTELGSILHQDLDFLDKLFYPSKDVATSLEGVASSRSQRNPTDDSPVQELAEQKLAMLQLRLDETTKTISGERQEKNKLMKAMEKIQTELGQLRAKYEDLKCSRQDALKELNQMKAEHQDEMDSIRLDLEEEANSRSTQDQRLSELRSELERLQAENASEWGRSERLETDKLALERENKKLQTQIHDLGERLERKAKQMSDSADSDVKSLQVELHEKNKELVDLKHAHGKLKKVLQDKSTELSHALRRSEQYESEVKKLRSRVEELKKELAVAEDEVDSAANGIRKLQRTNEDLQEQVETYHLQVEHLQSRLSVLKSSAQGAKNDVVQSPGEPSPLVAGGQPDH